MMMDMLPALAIGYLLGSIPFGLILTKMAGGGDVRSVGSGNIGATNVLRAGGKGPAAATLVLDALKATVAVVLVGRFFEGGEIFAAAGAIIGHLYPVWLRFRGGKGVATFLGALIPLMPVAAMLYAAVWLFLLATVRISSLAGLGAAVSAPLAAAAMGEDSLFPLFLAVALLIVWRHRENLVRLRNGTEPRIGKRTS